MGRCGTHAIIGWIAGHFNCIATTYTKWVKPNNTIQINIYTKNNKVVHKETKTISISDVNFYLSEFKVQALIVIIDPLILTSQAIDKHDNGINELMREGCIPLDFNESKNFLVIRTPWNHYASILQWKCRTPLKRKPRRFIRGWLSYAYEYLRITKFIPNLIKCSYDRWFVDKSYRKSISKSFGEDFSDDGLNFVDSEGRGSSFDQSKYCNRAQEMKVMERWKTINSCSDSYNKFMRVAKRRRIIKFAKKIFGQIPDFNRKDERHDALE